MTREIRPAPSSFWVDDRGVSLMLVSGAATVGDRPRTVLIVSVISVTALLVRWASWLFPEAGLAVWREISTLASLVALCSVVLALVLRRGSITTRRIEGAIVVYLLLGFSGRRRTSWWRFGIREPSRERSMAGARCRSRTTAS